MLRPLLCAFACLSLACAGTPGDGDFADGDGGSAAGTTEADSMTSNPTGPAVTSGATLDTTTDDGDSTAAGPLLDVGSSATTTGPDTGPCEGGPAPVIPAVSCDDAGIVIDAAFDNFYLCRDLGSVPGVMPEVGGMTFSLDEDDTLWIGGRANHVQGRLYAIEVTRDAACHVNGFAVDSATEIGEAPYNDGGFAYGPDGTLFVAQWPQNDLAQYIAGDTNPTVEVALGPLGVGPDSIAGLNFVPPTFAGENQLKVVTWPGGDWFTLELTDDGMGAYAVGAVTAGPQLAGGPEGFVHISADNAGVDVESILVAEWLDNSVSIYEADDQGDPVVASRQPFVTGLEGALGAHLDRVAGDFLFTTFGGGDRLIAIRGFLPNPRPEG